MTGIFRTDMIAEELCVQRLWQSESREWSQWQQSVTDENSKSSIDTAIAKGIETGNCGMGNNRVRTSSCR